MMQEALGENYVGCRAGARDMQFQQWSKISFKPKTLEIKEMFQGMYSPSS